jgi:hypothetical protein
MVGALVGAGSLWLAFVLPLLIVDNVVISEHV